MLNFLGEEVGTLISSDADFEDFVMRNLHQVTQRVPSGWSFSQISDEFILDVTTRPQVYPYFSVAHFDSERGTMRLYYIPATVFDIKSELQLIHDRMYNASTMAPWIKVVAEAIQRGETEIIFRDVDDNLNTDNTSALNNFQATWLRNNGFVVRWEKYPREWIVEGHVK